MGPRNYVQDVGPDPPQEVELLRGHVPAHGKVPTARECACTVHAADECIRHREG